MAGTWTDTEQSTLEALVRDYGLAAVLTAAGEIVEQQSRELKAALLQIAEQGQEALDGDSNDAEHDALFEAVEAANIALGMQVEAGQ